MSSNFSNSSLVCVDIIVTLSLLDSSGTVGGRMAGIKIPLLKRNSDTSNAFLAFPIIIGMMGLSDGAIFRSNALSLSLR